MKILLTNFHDGDGGGHTTYLLALAHGLCAKHEIHVAAPPSSRLYREAVAMPDIHAIAQPFPNGLGKTAKSLRERRNLRAYILQHDFDIIHVNGSADHRLVLAALRGNRKRPKLLLTKHNSKPISGPGHWWRARRTSMVLAVSDHTRRMLEASAYARCRLITIRNGVDITYYHPTPDATADARVHHAEDSALLLGSNAGTADHKGWMDLIEALASLPPELRQQVRVLLCGKPLSYPQRVRLDALGLNDAVEHAGMLTDVRPFIQAIDAGFVLSYAVETISFACREMMAMGKPVLVSDYAGLPENIESGVDGWCVPVRDRSAIAAAITEMLADRARLPDMGHRARLHAEREFGLDEFILLTEKAYLSLVSA